jgi:hypothetical protein
VLNAVAERQPRINQLSFSYSLGQLFYDDELNSAQALLQLGVQGQSVFVGSGDAGTYPGPCAAPFTGTPFDLALTLVGGTSLQMKDGGAHYDYETSWWVGRSVPHCSDVYPSLGGGAGYWPGHVLPLYQQDMDWSNNGGSSQYRNFPDVSMVAAGVLVCADNVYSGASPCYGTGGTSVSAPLWAGYTALVNEQRQLNGLKPIGFLNPALYAIGKSGLPGVLYDVNDGSFISGPAANATCPIDSATYTTQAGYDLATGWGTPGGNCGPIGLLGQLAAGWSRQSAKRTVTFSDFHILLNDDEAGASDQCRTYGYTSDNPNCEVRPDAPEFHCDVTADQPTAALGVVFNDCVGGEVRGTISLTCALKPDAAGMTVHITVQLDAFEGTNCHGDHVARNTFDYDLRPDEFITVSDFNAKHESSLTNGSPYDGIYVRSFVAGNTATSP